MHNHETCLRFPKVRSSETHWPLSPIPHIQCRVHVEGPGDPAGIMTEDPFRDPTTLPTSPPSPFTVSEPTLPAKDALPPLMSSDINQNADLRKRVRGVWGVMVALQIMCVSVFLGLIDTNARYGSARVCLLFVDNYRYGTGGYVFGAHSVGCRADIVLGSIALILLTGIGGLALIRRERVRQQNRRPISTSSIKKSAPEFTRPPTLWTRFLTSDHPILSLLLTLTPPLLLLTALLITNQGLSATCSQFSRLRGRPCPDVWDAGMYEAGNDETKYFVRYPGVVGAVGAAGVAVVAGLMAAGCKVWEWKRPERVRWW
ncbi:hypothetical protein DFS34DRAFT_621521 [Phlyctochytrium arcticum]|nr:hypothetical protein DFS34DRAFT_621521 [Phlyctochytrium arcticum]